MLGGLKAASGASVAQQGFGGLVHRALHQCMVVFVFKFFACNPFAGSNQRNLALQMPDIPLARGGRLFFKFDDGFNHIN